MRKDTRTIRDENGPAQAPLRLRINVGDYLSFVHEHGHEKKQQLQRQGPQKNVEAAQATKQRQSLLRDFDKGLGRHGEEDDFLAVGQNMVLSSGGAVPGASSAFNGAGALMGNVMDLEEAGGNSEDEDPAEAAKAKGKAKAKAKGKASAKDSAAEEDGGEAPEEEVESEPPQPEDTQPKKRAKWFDAESRINQLADKVALQVTAVQKALEAAVQHCSQCVLAAGQDADYAKHVSVARFRVSCARAVLAAEGAEPLAQVLAAVADRREKPPCNDWAALTTLPEVSKRVDGRFDALRHGEPTADAVEAAGKQVLQDLALYNGLAASTKTVGSSVWGRGCGCRSGLAGRRGEGSWHSFRFLIRRLDSSLGLGQRPGGRGMGGEFRV